MASEAVLQRLVRIGQGLISADQGLLSLALILRTATARSAAAALPQLAVNGFLWDTYLKAAAPPFFAEFASQAAEAQGRLPAPSAAAAAKKAAPATDPAAIKEHVHTEVKAAILQVLGSSIGEDDPLMSAGLDSLGSVEFANLLGQKLGLQMPGTLVFDYPSVSAVTDYLASQLSKAAAAADPNPAEEEAEADSSAVSTWDQDALVSHTPGELGVASGRQPLSILAVVARPLQASSAEGGVLAGSTDCIQRVPLDRWDLDIGERLQRDSLTLSAQFGAFMEGIDLFDAAAFGLSVGEAAIMDPQHRLVLEAAGEAMLAAAPSLSGMAGAAPGNALAL